MRPELCLGCNLARAEGGRIDESSIFSPNASKKLTVSYGLRWEWSLVARTYSLDRDSFDEKVNCAISPQSSMFAKLSYMSADVFSPRTLGVGAGTGLSPGGAPGVKAPSGFISGNVTSPPSGTSVRLLISVNRGNRQS